MRKILDATFGLTVLLLMAFSVKGQGAVRLYNEAQEHFLQNEFSLAEEKVRISIKLQKANPDAWFLWGQCRMYQNDPKTAIKYYDKAIGYIPSNAEYHYHKGLALEKTGKSSKAVREWSRTTKLDPRHGPAWKHLGMTFYRAGDYEMAIEDFDRALIIETTDEEAYMMRGAALSKAGRYEEAADDYTLALGLDPQNEDAYFNRARAYAGAGNAIRAVQDYTTVIEMKPKDAEARLSRGVVLMALGLLPQALADLDTTIMIDSALASGWWNRALLLNDMERWDEAQRSATTATRLSPNDPAAWLLLGKIEFRRKKYAPAIAAYDRCLELYPKYAEAFLNRGEAKRVIGEEEEACEDWKRVMKYDDGEFAEKAKDWHKIVCEE